MNSPSRTTALGAASVALALAIGIFAGAKVGDDGSKVRSLAAAAERARNGAALVRIERDKLRAERDRLETLLAAEKAPAVCPHAFVSTAELLPGFTVEYPCGWHAVNQPAPGTATEDRPGLQVSLTLLSPLPISLAPRQGPAADIEIADWTDDPSDTEDRLPVLSQWLAEERKGFRDVKERRLPVGALTGFELAGTIALEEPAPATVMLWEYQSAAPSMRHVVRVFSLAPSKQARNALTRIARTFAVRAA